MASSDATKQTDDDASKYIDRIDASGMVKEEIFLVGRVSFPPKQLFRGIAILFCAIFTIHRMADIAYLSQTDARFPAGVEYEYTSDSERLRTLSYTKQMTTLSFIYAACNFGVVLALVCTSALSDFDTFLASVLSWFAERISQSCGCCECFKSIGTCIGACVSCVVCFPWNRFCGFQPKWGVLFHGAVYLTLLGCLFYIVSAPFKLWAYDINASFGFTNTLQRTRGSMQADLIGTFFQSTLLSSIPSFMLYLAVLQCRHGWLLMWALMMFVTLVSQYNIAVLIPMVSSVYPFPASEFGVGHNFPLANPERNVSLNRIFYPDANNSALFVTHDASIGDVELTVESGASKQWVLRETNGSTIAKLQTPIGAVDDDRNLERIDSQPWIVGDEESPMANIEMRKGKELREALLNFAEAHSIGITEVFMIDGSSEDIRANAFAAGAGSSRIIALYDTLFLGDKPEPRPQADDAAASIQKLFSINHVSKKLRGIVDVEHNIFTRKARHGKTKPSVPMTDVEILGIMGHELGHSALHHVEIGTVVESVISFWTFALLGWMVQSPAVAASLGLSVPIAHIGVFFYNHVAGFSLDSVLGFVNNAISRQHENEADAYSARVSEEYATALQTALAKLTVNCNADPNEPWYYEALHDDHPTTAKRWASVENIKRHKYKDANKDEQANEANDLHQLRSGRKRGARKIKK